MDRKFLYLIVGVLGAGVIFVGYLYYQESQSGVSIEIGEGGVSIEGD